MRPIGILLLGAATIALTSLDQVHGCAAVHPSRLGTPVQIADESALIVWDAPNKTQHFIRRASFQTNLPYFGFLVPTPTRPELAPAPDEIFSRMEDWTKPEIQHRTETIADWGIGCGAAPRSEMTAKAGRVDVLESKRVGSFDVAILRADDTEALGSWLSKKGYDARPVVRDWLKPYVEHKWIITAFQIAKDVKDSPSIATEAVRMSFTTDRPFFPYSEPADMREGNSHGARLLRVFFAGPARVRGALDDGKAVWPGKTVWADRLSADHRKYLADQLKLPGGAALDGPWLTVLEDKATPRPGVADLYFSADEKQEVLYRPRIVQTNYVKSRMAPIASLVLVVAVFVLIALACRNWRVLLRLK